MAQDGTSWHRTSQKGSMKERQLFFNRQFKKLTDFTLSVIIRTAVGKENLLPYYAGCGIVWDSNPEQELSELYLKVKAFYLKDGILKK
ncbi:chorismate-binding protein [Thermodesulfovibrio sp. 1176]|uniref:chorismate-binding protein n=2 Tax=unclassified Thermodesulfovibrio TaxID=2645936 RepID=UPI0009F6B764|nr:chorismate-binding protein [Thermodesulfovibrio sp. 1176]